MWPGLVGKEEGSPQSPIGLDRMLELTTGSSVAGRGFDGVDLFLYQPHLDIDAGGEAAKKLANHVAGLGLQVGTLVAPVWSETGGGSAMGTAEDRASFVEAVRKSCRYGQTLREEGVREGGSIRIDSACSVEDWLKNPAESTKLIAETFTEAAQVAEEYGEVLVAEGEICWGGMHSWKDMLDLLEAVGRPGRFGFQADLAHTYLYLLGYNAEEHALVAADHSEEEFDSAYREMTSKLAPWTYDFHVAQNDGTVHGTGTHDKTGRHCAATDPKGKLDIVKCASYWLLDEQGKQRPEISHLCWDGCMFPNAILEEQQTWNEILAVMQEINRELSPTSPA